MARKKSLADELAELINPAPKGRPFAWSADTEHASRADSSALRALELKECESGRNPLLFLLKNSELDPEAVDLDGTRAGSIAWDGVDDEGAQARPSTASKEKPRMRADITLEDAAYRGKRTTRAAVFGDGELGSGSQEEDDGGVDERPFKEGDDEEEDDDDMEGSSELLQEDEEEMDDGVEGSEEEDEDDEEEDANAARHSWRKEHRKAAARGRDKDDDDKEGDDQEDEEEARAREALGGSGRGGRGDDGGDDLAAEFAGALAQDQAALASLRTNDAKERQKGVAVKHQQALYDRALEVRILLQKCVGGANRFPRPAAHRAIALSTASGTAAELRAGVAALQQDAAATLEQLLQLQGALFDQNASLAAAAAQASSAAQREAPATAGKRARAAPAAAAAAGSSSSSRSSDELWEEMECSGKVLAAFRDLSLDRWHKRVRLSSGAGALRSSLRSLDQSISSQVAALMRDTARVVKRSHLPLTACPKVLCQPAGEAPTAQASALEANGGGGDHQGDDASSAAHDPETFDDSEFYQQLLKEFLEAGAAAGLANGAVGAAAVRSAAAKRRNVVDRRASKGRKLRYDVHEKLVNFMVPAHFEPPAFATQLFANLFGHRGPQ